MSSCAGLQRTGKNPHQSEFTGDAVLIVDKPKGITSHDVVKKVKRRLGAAKVGHTGTLDPFATGVLILLLNNATKLAPFLAEQEKEYRFNVHFGVETDTQDSTGTVVATRPCKPLSKAEIKKACAAFIGEIEQRVPRYSAVRVRGKRLYQLARQGVEITPPSRKVKIKRFTLQEFEWPEATFEVTCSKGTYVRSLGVDLARNLNCCGHVSQLRRLASGGFDLGRAVPLVELDGLVAKGNLGQVLIPSAEALHDYPALRVSYLAAEKIRQGGALNETEFQEPGVGGALEKGPYKILDPEDNLVAIVAKPDDKTLNDGKENRLEILRVFRAGHGAEN